MSIEIDFTYQIDGLFHSVNYYRSKTPMNVASMPSPTATGITGLTFTDATAANNELYYVRFGSVRSGAEKISPEIEVYGGTGDKYWDKVAVLMHFNSSSGSTTSFYEEKHQVFLPRIGSTYIESSGRFNEGIFFGRSGSRAVQIPASYYALKNKDFTFNISLKFTQLSSNAFYDIVGQRGNYSSNQSYAFYYYTGSSKFHFEFSSDGASMGVIAFDYAPDTNRYHDYQIKRNGDSLILEVDGLEVGRASLPTGFTFYESTAHHQLALTAQSVAPTTQTHPTWFDEFRVTIGVARPAKSLTEEFKNFI